MLVKYWFEVLFNMYDDKKKKKKKSAFKILVFLSFFCYLFYVLIQLVGIEQHE